MQFEDERAQVGKQLDQGLVLAVEVFAKVRVDGTRCWHTTTFGLQESVPHVGRY